MKANDVWTGLQSTWALIQGWIFTARFLSGVGAVVVVGVILWLRGRRFSSEAVTIGLPFSLGSITYNTTPTDRVVAWKLYVQLTTRKAALPFDAENDLIVEVYDSLFALFGETRDLLLTLPVHEFERRDGIASLMIRVLNDGVRPHLTRWQADFRKWWESALADGCVGRRRPQDVQRTFPQYQELVDDLKQTNSELTRLADELLMIARPLRGKKRRVAKVVPVPPTLEMGVSRE